MIIAEMNCGVIMNSRNYVAKVHCVRWAEFWVLRTCSRELQWTIRVAEVYLRCRKVAQAHQFLTRVFEKKLYHV